MIAHNCHMADVVRWPMTEPVTSHLGPDSNNALK